MTENSNPPSFAPKKKSARSSKSSSDAANNVSGSAPNNAMPASFAPRSSVARSHDASAASSSSHSSSPASADIPPSFSPHAQSGVNHAPRSSQGSSSSSSSYRPAQTYTQRNYAEQPSYTRPSSTRSSSRKTTPTNAGYQQKTKRGRSATRHLSLHNIRNRILTILLIIVIVLGLGGIGLYSWVNANLNKEDWLTPMANNSKATSWLILGSDKRDSATGDDGTVGERTDTILVLTKPKSGPASLISIPRDSLVQVDGYYMKINAVLGQYGNEALVGEVEDITGYKIDHVAKLSFSGLVNVVDALGGVELCLDYDVNDEKSGLVWTAGCHVADGTTALAFSRMRYSDPNGDFGRAERQRQVIGAIAKKGASLSTLLNFGKDKAVAQALLAALSVDKKTTPWTLIQMLFAFKDASGSKGITGSVYWTDPDYYVDGVGSSVLLDDSQNTELFTELSEGTHAAGTVGTLASTEG